jgi:hypothetical protein
MADRFHCSGNAGRENPNGCGLLSYSTASCKCPCQTCTRGRQDMAFMRAARKDFVTKHAAEIHVIMLKNFPGMLSTPELRQEAIRKSVQYAEEFADSRSMLKEEGR